MKASRGKLKAQQTVRLGTLARLTDSSAGARPQLSQGYALHSCSGFVRNKANTDRMRVIN